MSRLLFGPLGPAPLLAWLSILIGLAAIYLPGLSLALLFGKIGKTSFNFYHLPILGLAGAIWYAEVWSLFLRVDAKCLLSLIVISTCLSFCLIRYKGASLQDVAPPKTGHLTLLVLFSFLVAINAGSRMNSGDSGIYHLNAIRWIQELGSPPGIANVHTRLGFNCSLFVAVALLNGIVHAVQVTNGIVLVACAIYFFGLFSEINFDPRHRGFLFLFAASGGLVLPALSLYLSSPSPDVSQSALAICTLVAGAQYFLLEKSEANLLRSILILLLIASLHAKFKASGIALASGMVACAGLVLACQGKTVRARLKVVAGGATFFVFLVLPWVARGYLTSGYPLFPSTLLGAAVDWKVPEAMANEEAAWIYAWARNPGVDWKFVLTNNDWLGSWWRRNTADPTNQGIAAFWVISIGILARGKRFNSTAGSAKISPSWWKLACFVPTAAAVMFWFRTAPDPRFGNGLLWTFGLGVLLWAVPSTSLNKKSSIFYPFLTAIPVAILAMVGANQVLHEKYSFPARYRTIPLKQLTSSYGVRVFAPRSGDQVGDSPIPAAPENRFQINLQCRGKTLAAGFRINGEVIFRNQ